jgi:hypothetical protein
MRVVFLYMTITVADGKIFFKCCIQFFEFYCKCSQRYRKTCSALHAICGFRKQHCIRRSKPDKDTFFLYFDNFSSVFRDVHKGKVLFHVTGICKHYCYVFERFTCSLLFQLKNVANSFFSTFKKGHAKSKKIRGNKSVLHSAI